MVGDASELSVQTYQHPVNRWIIVRFDIEGAGRRDMVLDTGSPLSSVSVSMRDSLAEANRLEAVGPNRHMLRGLTVEGWRLPDLPVRLSRRVTQVGADGVLGLDFLAQFREICFDVASLKLALRR